MMFVEVKIVSFEGRIAILPVKHFREAQPPGSELSVIQNADTAGGVTSAKIRVVGFDGIHGLPETVAEIDPDGLSASIDATSLPTGRYLVDGVADVRGVGEAVRFGDFIEHSVPLNPSANRPNLAALFRRCPQAG